MLNAQFTRRFDELAQSFSNLQFHSNHGGMSGMHVKTGDWMRWATSAQSLIRAVYGEGEPHYQNFVHAIEKCAGYEYDVLALRGIFLAAKDDYDGGYVFNVDLRISGEVFGDFLALAKQALSEGNKDVAAVLACAALEDSLKRYATSGGLSVDGKSMQDVVNLLKANSLVAGVQKSLLDTMPKIRNAALHADWQKISEPDVASVIGFVEQFLLVNFSI
jgi:hypothetical protein